MSLIIIDSFGLPKNKRFKNIINVFEKITKKNIDFRTNSFGPNLGFFIIIYIYLKSF